MQRLAIVTGVSRGLGAALAHTLLARGWTVVGIGRHDAADLAQAARQSGDERYRFVRCDLADAAALDAAVGPVMSAAAALRPAVAALVNNAADAGPIGVFGALDAPALAASLSINLAAPAALSNLFCRSFTDPACDRRIVNVSSGAAERTLEGGGAYCVAKAGLEMLTRMIASEQQGNTLRAITLRPGVIDTQMQVFMRSQAPERLPSLALFQGFHRGGQLVAASEVARKTVDRLLEAPIEQGRTYSYAEL
jgi:NAD(P)-dependent dehydrogenase (short-subunit alcohol dehydrogenase family)